MENGTDLHHSVCSNHVYEIPKMEFCSNARPSLFAYPPPVEEKKQQEWEKMTIAILSITGRVKHREAEHLEAGRVQPGSMGMKVLTVLQQMSGANYSLVKDLPIGGIVMIRHLQPGTPEETVEHVAAYGPNSEEVPEPHPPEPFEYTDE